MIYNASSYVNIDLLFGTLPKEHQDFLLTNAFVELAIMKEISAGKKATISGLEELLENAYPWAAGAECFKKINGFSVFDYDSHSQEYRPYNRFRWNQIFDCWRSANSYFERGMSYSEQGLEAEMTKVLSLDVPTLPLIIGNIVALWVKKYGFDQKNGEIIAFELSKQAMDCQTELQAILTGMDIEASNDEFFEGLPAEAVMTLKNNGIESLDDFALTHPEKLIAIFLPEIELLNICMSRLAKVNYGDFANGLLQWVSCLKDKELEVLKLRCGTKGVSSVTLEEAASRYGVTRERIRQIEAKATIKLRHASRIGFAEQFLKIFVAVRGMNKFWEIADIDKLMEPYGVEDIIRIIPSVLANKWFFIDEKTGILFNVRSEMEFNSLIDEMLADVPDSISPEGFEALDDTIKKVAIAYNKYKMNKTGFYSRVGLNVRDEYLRVVKEAFPNGYRIYSDEDYARFTKAWKDKRGANSLVPSAVAIRGAVSSHWRLCDEGTYLPKEVLPSITDELREKIDEFIYQHLPAVYYKSIYMAFEDEAKSLGFTNSSMLKGAYDAVSDKFDHCRDYLKDKKWPGTCYDAIYAYIMSLEGIFTFDDLRVKFPFVEDYVFLFCLGQKPDQVIHLSKQYYLANKEGIFNEQAIDELRIFIDNYLAKNSLDYVSCIKIFEKLKFADKTYLLERLKFVFDENSLLNFVDAVLGSSFDVSGMYICHKGVKTENRWDAFQQYLEGIDEFDKADIDYAASKIGFSSNYTFMDVVNLMSKTHVQIDKDKLVRLDTFITDTSTIDNFARTIASIMKLAGSINTENFSRYFMLPTLQGIAWNKYVLVGLVRSCLSDEYTIEMTKPDYRNTDFIIKKGAI